MSFSVDANILLYASDQSSDRHHAAQTFLRRCAQGSDLFFLGYPTLMSYLRIATHPGIFPRPLTPDEAWQNVCSLAGSPNVRLLAEEQGFLDLYQEVLQAQPIRDNLVPDAHLATLLRQHGVRLLYTCDRDFRRFEFLQVRDPFVS
ncbi:MAG: PIN domain-containing protein [Armatimonadetes bacterium]|nr:PIN domain-containing protein [Armatimonadota bacterium]